MALGDSFNSSTGTTKQQFPNINELADTLKMTLKGNTLSSGSVQILHVNGNHWITVSTMLSTEMMMMM